MVVFFAAQLTYGLWRRRRFRKESAVSEEIDRSVVSSVMSNNESFFATTATPPPPSKELLLYNLCWNNQVPSSMIESTSPFISPGTPVMQRMSTPSSSVMPRLQSQRLVQTSYNSYDGKDRKEFDAKINVTAEDRDEEKVLSFSSASSTPFYSSPPHPSTIMTRALTP